MVYVTGGRGGLYQITLGTSNRGLQNCFPNEVKTYLDENKVETLHQAATLADNYTLTHQKVFVNSDLPLRSGQRPPGTVRGANLPVSGNQYNLRSNDRGQNDPTEQCRRSHSSQSAPVCHYYKCKGHVMLECWVLENKEKNKQKATLVVKKAESPGSTITLTDRSPLPKLKLPIPCCQLILPSMTAYSFERQLITFHNTQL